MNDKPEMMQCGEITQHVLLQDRRYFLRLPTACSVKEVVPLLVLLHCYGCPVQ